jgi:RimJ/RimL family protein N-acetyltransferase
MKPKKSKLKNGQIVTIRHAERTDAGHIIKCVNKVAGETNYLTFGADELGISVEKAEEFIEGHLNSDNKLFIIAEIDGIIVGTLGFAGGEKSKIRHRGEFGVSVLKEYWGLGIGKKLVETLIEWAKSSGVIKKINLIVRSDDTRAIELYKQLGFCQEGLISREHFIGGRFYDSLFMGLQLDEQGKKPKDEQKQ